jgi:hypothetical protein
MILVFYMLGFFILAIIAGFGLFTMNILTSLENMFHRSNNQPQVTVQQVLDRHPAQVIHYPALNILKWVFVAACVLGTLRYCA